MYDVIIIGAGVSGCAIARELSRYQVNACVLEKEEDVCCGTSKANSAIVHAGYDAMPGTLMAKLNVAGNEQMELIAKELDVPFKRNGSLVVCLNEEDVSHLEDLYQRGVTNGVKGLRILSREECKEMEPNLSDEVYAALYAPTAGIVCPFLLTIAFAENSFVNGIQYFFYTQVEQIEKKDEVFHVHTNQGNYTAKCIVNAAGVSADTIHNMVSKESMRITPRRGEYCLLDKAVGNYVEHTIFSLPSKYGKGVLVAPTIHGNLLVGPTACDLMDKENTATTREGLEEVISKANMTIKDFPIKQIITSFAGLRAHEEGHEFIIEEIKDCSGFIDVAGIESPGLASAPAIGTMVAELLKVKLELKEKETFHATRKGIVYPMELNIMERKELIAKNPSYGTMICRCEHVSEGEILDAINRPLGAHSLDGIKRRVRAGSGRCQGGFCSPKVMELLAKEENKSMYEITKSGGGSKLVYRKTKGQ